LARKKKSSTKKKRDRKKGSAHDIPPVPATTPVVDEAPVIDLDAEEPVTDDLDGEALVIDLDAETPVIEPDADEPVTIDLDADLGEGDEGAVERLIAEALADSGEGDAGDHDEERAVYLDEQPATLPSPGLAAAAPLGTPETPQSPDRPPAAPEASPPQTIERGPISTPAVRDRLLAEALAHAEHKDAGYRVPYDDQRPARLWKGLLIVACLVIAGTVAIFPPAVVRPDPPASLGSADELRSLRIALLLQAHQVEAYRIQARQLPASLSVLPSRLPGIVYVRSGNRAYQLIAYESDGTAMVYDSANPTPPFRVTEASWTLRSAPP
jgi:hypothetical protein